MRDGSMNGGAARLVRATAGAFAEFKGTKEQVPPVAEWMILTNDVIPAQAGIHSLSPWERAG